MFHNATGLPSVICLRPETKYTRKNSSVGLFVLYTLPAGCTLLEIFA
jgi:hypothetical protein